MILQEKFSNIRHSFVYFMRHEAALQSVFDFFFFVFYKTKQIYVIGKKSNILIYMLYKNQAFGGTSVGYESLEV